MQWKLTQSIYTVFLVIFMMIIFYILIISSIVCYNKLLKSQKLTDANKISYTAACIVIY